MKKKTQLMLACIAVMGIGIIIINACSKTENEKVNQQGLITHFSPSKDMVVPTITKFIQRFEDYKAGYKTGGEDIKLGEAVWTLEAGINYEFQGSKDDLSDFTTDSLSITVDVFIGEKNEYYIAEADVLELYDEVLEFTNDQIASEDTDLLVSDFEATSVENNQAEVRVISVKGAIAPPGCSISSTDYWYAAAGAGMCGAYIGQGSGKDAANKINYILNCILRDTYWTDITTFTNVTSYYGPNNEPCFWGMDYSGDWDDCLSPTEIEDWLDLAEYVIDGKTPTGKDFIDANFDDDVLVGQGTWFHYFAELRYGIPQGDPTK